MSFFLCVSTTMMMERGKVRSEILPFCLMSGDYCAVGSFREIGGVFQEGMGAFFFERNQI